MTVTVVGYNPDQNNVVTSVRFEADHDYSPGTNEVIVDELPIDPQQPLRAYRVNVNAPAVVPNPNYTDPRDAFEQALNNDQTNQALRALRDLIDQRR
jgi:hypothetical protein